MLWFTILCIVILLLGAFLIFVDLYNRDYDWKGVCGGTLMGLGLLVLLFASMTWAQSRNFYQDFVKLQHQIEYIDSVDNYYEVYYIADVMNSNSRLLEYQKSFQKYGSLSIYYSKLAELQPIQLETFNIN